MRVSSRWWLWRLPLAGAIVAAIVFAVGFALALKGSAGAPLAGLPPPPVTPKPMAAGGGRRLLLVLGDSLARGTGDENGRGFAGDLEIFLARRGPTEVANLGVNGAESEDVRQSVQSANVRTLAASASWILLSAGGNDLSHAVPRAGPSAQALEQVGRARQSYLHNLREILEILRQANPSAPIYLVGLYSPFEEEGPTGRVGASVILSWNAAAQETALAFPRVFVVPTFDLFFGRPERLAADRFHPNRSGYAAIAQRLEQLLPPS